MSSSDLTTDDSYQSLLGKISEVYTTGQTRATQAVNTHITETYWQIGHDIVEFEQGGKTRADYGTGLLASLSRDLTLRHGKGFSRSNLSRFRQFYLAYPNCAKASHKLSWSHYAELLKLEDTLERSFYEQQAITCQECDEKVPFIDFIEQRLKSDPVARKIAAFCSAQKVSGLLRFWRWTRRPRANSARRRWSKSSSAT